jgi:hypothetical protein
MLFLSLDFLDVCKSVVSRVCNDGLRNRQTPCGLSHALPFHDSERNVKVSQVDAAANAVGQIHEESA